jgi:hypothetical protein
MCMYIFVVVSRGVYMYLLFMSWKFEEIAGKDGLFSALSPPLMGSVTVAFFYFSFTHNITANTFMSDLCVAVKAISLW